MAPDRDALSARYSNWFYAAAIYNLIWGGLNVLFPHLFFDLVGIARPAETALWQVLGMFVMVFAPAYWWMGRHPYEHRHFIVIGLLGKVLGPLGFVWALAAGRLPLAFGWTILTNDLIWWPAFGSFLGEMARGDGLLALLKGE
jgi:hypothetical protein